MTPQQIMEELQAVNLGMNGTPASSGLSIMADVSAGAGEDAGNE
jgi:hypothetical protein